MGASFSQRLRALRGEMSADEFARKLGVGKTALYRYEKDEGQPDAMFLFLLHQWLGVSVDWLLTGGQAYAPTLSAQEAVLIENFRKMAPDDRLLLLENSARLSRIDWAAIAEANKSGKVLPVLTPEERAEQTEYAELQVKKTKREAKTKVKAKKAS